MNKKAMKYIIILLFIPLIILFIIRITNYNKINNMDTSYNGIDIPNYKNDKNNIIKRSDHYIYLSVFSLVFISGGVYLYIKSKRGL